MRAIAIVILFWFGGSASAGVHYSGEKFRELPSRWNGFLQDLRLLRLIAADSPNPSIFRKQYLAAAEKLQALSKHRELTTDEIADLGAIYLRLGKTEKAIDILRASSRRNPNHFATVSNLGTAWQIQGDLVEAKRSLEEAVRLAPEKWKSYEAMQLRVIQSRLKQTKEAKNWDNLFGVSYLGDSGKPEAGKIASAQKKMLPENDVAVVQQLALWLPADGLLIWQLGELANAHRDVRTAAALLDGCVQDYALSIPDLRLRRKIYRTAADAIAELPDDEHSKYRGNVMMKSARPLTNQLDSAVLPAVRKQGVNSLPWVLLSETEIHGGFKPHFHEYLDKLEGMSVSMTGYMYTSSDGLALQDFLLVEYPIGCWFCETPDTSVTVKVNLDQGQTIATKKGLIKVQGKLKLNHKDPEEYLYTIDKALVTDPD